MADSVNTSLPRFALGPGNRGIYRGWRCIGGLPTIDGCAHGGCYAHGPDASCPYCKWVGDGPMPQRPNGHVDLQVAS